MADVFISYARADRSAAEALAADLKAKGYDVWWDFDLYAGENFHDRILAEIDGAKAVIVIWSDAAVASDWVRGEANYAAAKKKLIATHTPAFNTTRVPLNLQGLHSENVTDRDRITRALQHKGVPTKPTLPTLAPFTGLALKTSVSVGSSRKDDWALCRGGDKDLAIPACTRIIEGGKETQGDLAIAYRNRGIAHGAKGQHDRAIGDYSEAIRLKPDFADAYFNRGLANYARGNAYGAKGLHDRAIADYDHAIRLKPDDADAYYARGNAYDTKGQHDRAIADYDQAIRLKPDDADAYYDRGNAYDAKGLHDRAIADYDHAIRLKPGYAAAYASRGLAYEQKGDRDSAKRDFYAALAVPAKHSTGQWAHHQWAYHQWALPVARARLVALGEKL